MSEARKSCSYPENRYGIDFGEKDDNYKHILLISSTQREIGTVDSTQSCIIPEKVKNRELSLSNPALCRRCNHIVFITTAQYPK